MNTFKIPTTKSYSHTKKNGKRIWTEMKNTWHKEVYKIFIRLVFLLLLSFRPKLTSVHASFFILWRCFGFLTSYYFGLYRTAWDHVKIPCTFHFTTFGRKPKKKNHHHHRHVLPLRATLPSQCLWWKNANLIFFTGAIIRISLSELQFFFRWHCK